MPEYRPGRGPFFVQVPFELQEDPEADAYTIAVYAAIRRFADFGKATGARPSDDTLAKYAGCSPRIVRDRRDRLRKAGWLEWDSRNGQTNTYMIHASRKGQETPAAEEKPAGDDIQQFVEPQAAEPQPVVVPRRQVPRSKKRKARQETPSPSKDRGTRRRGGSAGGAGVPRRQAPTTENPDREPSTEIPVGEPDEPAPTPWNQRACGIWADRFGGTVPGARITKALRPLVGKHGPQEVLDKFAEYLKNVDPRFAAPETFATKYGVTGELTSNGRNGNNGHGRSSRGPNRSAADGKAANQASVPRAGSSRYDRNLERFDGDVPTP